jgi:hypothetical protein
MPALMVCPIDGGAVMSHRAIVTVSRAIDPR